LLAFLIDLELKLLLVISGFLLPSLGLLLALEQSVAPESNLYHAKFSREKDDFPSSHDF
jgi:hypothetical protein